MSRFVSFLLLVWVVGCGGDRERVPVDAGPGVTCGATTCARGQVCCIDCDGTGTCGTPGSACPGDACLPAGDAGGVDGGAVTPVACGATTCGAGEVCCIDCDGAGSCGAPGTACRGDACMPPGRPCGAATCSGTDVCLTCCGPGSEQCSPAGTACSGVPCPGECPEGTCRLGLDAQCEAPTGPTGNGCCECGANGMCAEFCRCASPTTRVATPDGERPISTLRVGDLVYTVDQGARVARPLVRVHRQPVADHAIVRMVTTDGAVVEMSPNHPTADHGTFGELGPGDRLGHEHRVGSIELVPFEHDATWDVLPASDTGVYFASGVPVGSTLTR